MHFVHCSPEERGRRLPIRHTTRWLCLANRIDYSHFSIFPSSSLVLLYKWTGPERKRAIEAARGSAAARGSEGVQATKDKLRDGQTKGAWDGHWWCERRFLLANVAVQCVFLSSRSWLHPRARVVFDFLFSMFGALACWGKVWGERHAHSSAERRVTTSTSPDVFVV